MVGPDPPPDSGRADVQRARRYFGGLLSAAAVVPAGARCCTALLVDIDDFIVRSAARGQAWAEQQVRAVEELVHDTSQGVLAATVHHLDPDEWVVVVGAEDDGTLVRHSPSLAEGIRSAVEAVTEVTVTVSFGAVAASDETDRSLAQALRAQDRKLVLGGNRVIDWDSASQDDGATPRLDSIEQPLSQRIRQGDRDGAVTLLRSWLTEATALDGVTPEILRRWVAAQMLSALNAAGERRASDGSSLWEEVLERASLEEFAALGTIHERSYLNLWLQRLIERVVDVDPNEGNPILALVTAYLDEHYSEDLSLVRVARAVGCSPYHVSHLFQRELDTTFLTALTAIRMARARTLLATTDDSVADVARAVGYGTARHFRTVFKRAVGVTPTAYRIAGQRPQPVRQAV